MGVTRFGRDPRCDVVLDDPTVSGRHAEFDRTSGGVLVRDAASFNGTYLNGDPCREATLTEGDEVWIGRFHLTFGEHLERGQPSA